MKEIHVAPWKLISLLVMTGIGLYLGFALSPSSTAFDLKDDPESIEIVAALQRFYDALHEAIVQEDVQILATAVADDPRYVHEIGAERAAQLREYIAEVSGPERALEFGYLTVMQNNLSHRLHGERLLAAEMARAEAEGREWTNADTEALADRNYGSPPTIREVSELGYIVDPRSVRTIEIDGDYAHATYEGEVVWNALFKRIDGQWQVIGIYQ